MDLDMVARGSGGPPLPPLIMRAPIVDVVVFTVMWSDDGVIWDEARTRPMPECGNGTDWHDFRHRGTNLYVQRGVCRQCGHLARRRKLSERPKVEH